MKSGKSNGSMIILAFVIGVPVFLLMTRPVIFWAVFLPIVVIGIVLLIRWLRR